MIRGEEPETSDKGECPPTLAPLHEVHCVRTTSDLRFRRLAVESHGTFGTIWASLGMTAYYIALIWINILLGLFLSPLFMIPMTWIQDRFAKKI